MLLEIVSYQILMEHTQHLSGGSTDTISPPFMKSGDVRTKEVHMVEDQGREKGRCVGTSAAHLSRPTPAGEEGGGSPENVFSPGPEILMALQIRSLTS